MHRTCPLLGVKRTKVNKWLCASDKCAAGLGWGKHWGKQSRGAFRWYGASPAAYNLARGVRGEKAKMKSALVPLLWGTVSVLIGWPFVEFVARPFRQFFDIRRQVARALVNYGNVGARSVRTQTGEWKTIDLHPEDDAQLVKAQEAYRGLAADMRAFANGEHLAYWAVKGFGYDANIIASALISLEVNLPVKGEDLHQSRERVEQLLRIRSTE